MRLLYSFQAEGIWYSHNGAKAYQRGEKPKELFPPDVKLIETTSHHVSRQQDSQSFTRELVMFYKLKE